MSEFLMNSDKALIRWKYVWYGRSTAAYFLHAVRRGPPVALVYERPADPEQLLRGDLRVDTLAKLHRQKNRFWWLFFLRSRWDLAVRTFRSLKLAHFVWKISRTSRLSSSSVSYLAVNNLLHYMYDGGAFRRRAAPVIHNLINEYGAVAIFGGRRPMAS